MSSQLVSNILRQRSNELNPGISRQSSREFASIWRSNSRDFSACVQQAAVLSGTEPLQESRQPPEADASLDSPPPNVIRAS